MILLLLACGAPTLESDWVTGPTLTLLPGAERGTANPFVLTTPFWSGDEIGAEVRVEVELRTAGAAATVWAWMLTTGEDPTVPDVASPLAYPPVTLSPDDEPVVILPYQAGDCRWSDFSAVENGEGSLGSGCSVGWQITAELRSGTSANVATRVRGIAAFYDGEGVDLEASMIEVGWAP